jgi:hypothetical protein
MQQQTVTIELKAPLPTRKPPTPRTVRRACRTLIAEAKRQGRECPSLQTLVADTDIRADLWYALDCPPAP